MSMMILLLFFKYLICLFLERGERKEKEKHQCVVASHAPPTRDLAPTQACALTGNQTCDPLVCRLALNPSSHTSQGNDNYFRMQTEDNS